ncbi:hypothetical protein M758_8G037900 [Ceratodon purpureus]|nr:hypothetical protein M758_8G037900 [Ceratodon purpureus]
MWSKSFLPEENFGRRSTQCPRRPMGDRGDLMTRTLESEGATNMPTVTSTSASTPSRWAVKNSERRS